MERALTPARRFLGALVAAGLFFAGSPGITGHDGSLLLAILGFAFWAGTVVRPVGERRRLAPLGEWLAGALHGALFMWWVGYIVWGALLIIGAWWGLYWIAAGALLRRLARRVPLPLAAAIAWTGVETLRSAFLPPFGLAWFRLGHHAHAQLWLAGSARVFGVEGLTFVIAGLGAGLAAFALTRRVDLRTLASAVAPLGIAVLTAALYPAPETVAGPRVLLVQPGFEQARKQYGDPAQNFADSRALTLEALAEIRRRGEPGVDLVCWGESMLSVPILADGLEDAVQRGAQVPSWEKPIELVDIAGLRSDENQWLRRGFLKARDAAGERIFPAGTSFCAGAEFYDAIDGQIRRQVALVLFDGQGARSEPALKQCLVPLGETLFGFERFRLVRDIAYQAGGYVPDFLPGERTGVLSLATRDGKSYRFSGTVCFDNAYPAPYVDAVRAGPLDFHLVVSNEAWYRESCELDQMVAFSRLIALSTGRSIVRATNSGVSLVLGPDGAELGRVEVGGSDRSVRGSGVWTVPVPAPGTAEVTPHARFSGFSRAFWIGLVFLAGLLPDRGRNRQGRNRGDEAG